MTESTLATTILSDVDYEQLVAEVSLGDQFLFLLERERGRENIHIAFPLSNGGLGESVPLTDFVAHLMAAAENLRR
jgi:hypothetical protein